MLKIARYAALAAALIAGPATLCFAQAGGGGGLLGAPVGRPVVREEQDLWEPVRSEAARVPEWAVLALLAAPQRALGAAP